MEGWPGLVLGKIYLSSCMKMGFLPGAIQVAGQLGRSVEDGLPGCGLGSLFSPLRQGHGGPSTSSGWPALPGKPSWATWV